VSRIRRLGFAAITLLALVVGGAPAYATEPLTTSGHVTDPDGFLSADERAHLESDAESLRSTYGVIIDAVVVPNFSDQKPSVWCQATLEKSRTAEKGILYVVSYEDGTDTYCADAQFARNLTTDPSLKRTFDDALANARNNYTSSPLTSDAVSAGISSFISDIDTTSYIHAQVHRYNITTQQGQDSRNEDYTTHRMIAWVAAIGLFVFFSRAARQAARTRARRRTRHEIRGPHPSRRPREARSLEGRGGGTATPVRGRGTGARRGRGLELRSRPVR
jgi:hypothetical protein